MRAQPNRKHRVPRKHKLGTGPALSAPAACPAEQGGQAGHGSTPQPRGTSAAREVTKGRAGFTENIPTVGSLE